MSSALVKRQKSRRSVAALAFLSNISLDGSHSDTKLSIFNRENELSQPEIYHKHKSEGVKEQNTGDEQLRSCEIGREGQVLFQGSCESKPSELDQTCSDDENVPILSNSDLVKCSRISSRNISPNRLMRRTSISGETREQILQQRKILGFSPAENYSLLGFDSTESIGSRSQRRSGSVSDSSSSATGQDPRIIKITSEDRIRDERVILVSKETNVPFMIYSSLPYLGHKRMWNKEAKYDIHGTSRKRHISSGQTRPLSTISDGLDPFDMMGLDKVDEGQEISYEQLLVPSRPFSHKKTNREQYHSLHVHHHHHQNPAYNRCVSHDPSVDRLSPPLLADKGAEVEDLAYYQHQNVAGNITYTPHLLDDPELVAGKHRTLLTFTSYITSVMDYVRPADLKKELNDKFRDRFPHIQLTLTKLRSLKREMKKAIVSECGTDLLTVALSYVYFEKLVLKGYISKQNRKACAGACMLLAAKLNDVKGLDLKNQIEKTETMFRLSRTELLASEFPVLVALEFTLHVPTWEIFPHYQRLMYG